MTEIVTFAEPIDVASRAKLEQRWFKCITVHGIFEKKIWAVAGGKCCLNTFRY